MPDRTFASGKLTNFMRPSRVNKRKILNDPVYGFISINDERIFNIIEHPFFQRLRRINQLGLTHLVYPGAIHTRFQHSIGAMHLMQIAISELRDKGHDITDEEAFSAEAAILLHDIGHGPFSHALEYSIVNGITHEKISELFIKELNKQFDGELDTALKIFNGSYHKKFLNKLVSSQLDMDRLDYMRRDSYFSGVSEGIINYERLLFMLDVVDDNLVIEAKGIYSVEKFITARRLMYWQVYLHKTVLVAEYMLMKLLQRARELALSGEDLYASPALSLFLYKEIGASDFENGNQALSTFSRLDDYDIYEAMKNWKMHNDPVLSVLAAGLVDRKLFRIEIQNEPFPSDYTEKIKEKAIKNYRVGEKEAGYFMISDKTSNYAYSPGPDRISILQKDGTVKDISEISDDLNITLLKKPTTKHFIIYPKDL